VPARPEDRGLIILTGASSGIGAATALIVADAGYSVCVNYRRNESAATELWLLSAKASLTPGALIDVGGGV